MKTLRSYAALVIARKSNAPRMLTLAAFLFGSACSLLAQEAGNQPTSLQEVSSEKVFSGLQPGEKTRPFKVLHFKKPGGEELEIVNKYDDSKTLICFIHRLSNDDRILYGLGLVDFYAKRHKDLSCHIVLLSDDRDKMERMLTPWTQGSLFSNSLLSLSADGSEGPGYYGLNRDVAMTVVIAKRDTVVSNLVFNAPNNRDLESIMKAIAIACNAPEPTLADVQGELREVRQSEMEKRIKASPVFKLAPNEELGRIMFFMVNAHGNRTVIAKRRSQELLDWAENNQERQVVLKKYCEAILSGDFALNQYSRAAIKKLLGNRRSVLKGHLIFENWPPRAVVRPSQNSTCIRKAKHVGPRLRLFHSLPPVVPMK
ncbi:MAG: hypothetical protein AAF483_28360 [Planctomycetota bacterium]